MKSTDNKIGKSTSHWLLSPWTVLAGAVLGCVIGLIFKEFATHLTIFAEIFLALIQMCVIPIIITAVVSSLARLVAKRISSRFLIRLGMIFLLGLIFASLVGLAAGVWGKPGVGLDENARINIGQMISKYGVEMVDNKAAASKGLSGFLKSIVPANVFSALSQGQTISILFFCIFFGISLGLVRTPAGKVTLLLMEGLYDAFQTLFGWILYILPFGLCFLFASHVSQTGLTIFETLIKFVVVIYLSSFLMIIFYNAVIWWYKRGSFFTPLIAIRQAVVVGLATSSSYATMPLTLSCLQENLKVDKGASNLVIPLGINLHSPGGVMSFVVSIILIAQIYNVPLGFQEIMIILSGSILASMGAAGVAGPGGLVILAFILRPLGLPTQTAIILLMAINPLIDPILAVVNIVANSAATVLVDEWSQEVNK